MFDVFFSSIALQICGLSFLTFVAIMFFSSNKEKNYSTNLFKYILIIAYVSNFLEMGIYAIDRYVEGSEMLVNIVTIFYTLSNVTWLSLFCIYIISKLLFKDLDNDAKKRKKIFIIFLVASLVIYLLSFILKVELHSSFYNTELYVIGGPYLYVIYTGCGVGFIALLYILIKKFKELDFAHKMVLIFILSSFVILVLFQEITHNEFSFLTYIMSTYAYAFYITIEGTDYKLLNMLIKSKAEAEEKNKHIHQYLDDISKDAINPLNNMLNLSTKLRLNNNDLSSIKQNMLYISNECTKLSSMKKEGDLQ